MRVSAKADYAVRAALELAAATDSRPLKREQISAAQNIPSKFLETIMLELKHAGIVKSTRGAEGGYALARPAEDISVADVIRAVDGPLANVRGERVETVEYEGAAASAARSVGRGARQPASRARVDQPAGRRRGRSARCGARADHDPEAYDVAQPRAAVHRRQRGQPDS